MSIKSRLGKLEEAAGPAEPFTFILESRAPKRYRGGDGLLYTHDAVAKRLAALGTKLQLRVSWHSIEDDEAPPQPNTLYIGWGDEEEEGPADSVLPGATDTTAQ